MKNLFTAYTNLNQTNRRVVTFVAAAAATAVGGVALVTPIAYGSAIADGAYFNKDKKVGARLRAGFFTFLIACAGGAGFSDTATSPAVAEAPAPVVEVVEVPAPVVEAPVVEEPAPEVNLVRGPFTTTSHWADEDDTSNSGYATYNPDTDTVSWETLFFGITDQDSCSNGKHNTGMDCSVTYDANGNPTQAIVIDDWDGYRVSTTTFKF